LKGDSARVAWGDYDGDGFPDLYIYAKFVESSALDGYPAGLEIPDTPKVSGSAVLQWRS
jgi:FG-GAP repeat